eukprot:25783_1
MTYRAHPIERINQIMHIYETVSNIHPCDMNMNQPTEEPVLSPENEGRFDGSLSDQAKEEEETPEKTPTRTRTTRTRTMPIPLPPKGAKAIKDEMNERDILEQIYDRSTWQMYMRITKARKARSDAARKSARLRQYQNRAR